MYKIIKDVINSKDYKLETILHKINKMYIEDKISEEEKSELDNLARSQAKAENSYDLQKQVDELRLRIEALEKENDVEEPTEPEEPQDEYLEFIQPTGAHNVYNTGAKITHNGKKYICKMDNCAWSPDAYPQGWEEVIEETKENTEI